jgi:maltose O-acetyltransferase
LRDVFAFLAGKLRSVPLSDIAYSQFESALMLLVCWIPGLPGFFARALLYKLLFKRLSGMSWIQPGVTFVWTNRLSVGKMFGVNSGTYINAVGGISIGDYVLLGSNITISSGKHPVEGREPPIFSRPAIPMQIVIEDDVWVGAGAVIMPGVTLRRGTVVGANAVVTADTESYSVVVGAPARKIRNR